MRWGWCPHGGQDNASRLRWPFPPLPFGGLSAAPLPSCSLFRPRRRRPLGTVSASPARGAAPAPPRRGVGALRPSRGAGGGGARPFWKGHASLCHFVISERSGAEGKDDVFLSQSPKVSGRSLVGPGGHKLMSDRPRGFHRPRGEAGGTSYRRQPPRAAERRATPCLRKAERISRARVLAPGIPNPAAGGRGPKGHLVQSPASGQASPAEASCVLPRAGAQVRAGAGASGSTWRGGQSGHSRQLPAGLRQPRPCCGVRGASRQRSARPPPRGRSNTHDSIGGGRKSGNVWSPRPAARRPSGCCSVSLARPDKPVGRGQAPAWGSEREGVCPAPPRLEEGGPGMDPGRAGFRAMGRLARPCLPLGVLRARRPP